MRWAAEQGREAQRKAPEFVRLVLAEAGGEVHGHAVLLAGSEEVVVLQGQRSAAVRHGIRRELERRFIAADDAQRVDCANDDDEVRHDIGDVVTQRAVDERAELYI